MPSGVANEAVGCYNRTMQKNDVIHCQITALGSQGEGIAEVGGRTLFLPFTLPGETVTAKVLKVKGNVAYGKLLSVETASFERVAPLCPLFGQCGGCQLQHLSYQGQLDFKRQLVRRTLKKLSGLDVDVPPVAKSPTAWEYRNKLSLPVRSVEGQTVIGFYRPRSHRVVAVEACPLQAEWSTHLIGCVDRYMREQNVSAYDETQHTGLVRHVIGRYLDGQLLVTVVVNGDELPHAEALFSLLSQKFSSFGLFVSRNVTKSNVITTEPARHLCGIDAIRGNQFRVDFTLQADSFYQVNEGIKNAIYSDVRRLLAGRQTEVLLDLFSGIGILSGALYSDAYDTVAVELLPSATADADRMKEANGLKRLLNLCGDVNEVLPSLAKQFQGKRVSVVVDPPRKGLDPAVISSLLALAPNEILYISCDVATLARDVARLSGAYTPTYIQPYDMFPQTRHVETLVCLRKKV